jgi:hypothetical protein
VRFWTPLTSTHDAFLAGSRYTRSKVQLKLAGLRVRGAHNGSTNATKSERPNASLSAWHLDRCYCELVDNSKWSNDLQLNELIELNPQFS